MYVTVLVQPFGVPASELCICLKLADDLLENDDGREDPKRFRLVPKNLNLSGVICGLWQRRISVMAFLKVLLTIVNKSGFIHEFRYVRDLRKSRTAGFIVEEVDLLVDRIRVNTKNPTQHKINTLITRTICFAERISLLSCVPPLRRKTQVLVVT